MLYISICHWAYHSYNIMTWASLQRHKTSHTDKVQTRLSVERFLLHFKVNIISAQETFTVVLVIFNRRRYTWKGRLAHGKISNRGALCKSERFLVVEEEVVLLLLIIFPYWTGIQQLCHLVSVY